MHRVVILLPSAETDPGLHAAMVIGEAASATETAGASFYRTTRRIACKAGAVARQLILCVPALQTPQRGVVQELLKRSSTQLAETAWEVTHPHVHAHLL